MRRTLTFDGNRLFIQQRPLPEHASDEVLIRPRLLGICSTDLELTRGYKEFRGIIGHEFVGDVVAGPDEWRGARVVGEINVVCGQCDMCLQGMSTQCRQRKALGITSGFEGAFADIFRLPVRNLHRVPDSLSDEEAVFTEPLAAACQVLEQVHIRPNSNVIVVGVGRLGMLVAQALHATSAHVTGVIRHERQRQLLTDWGISAQTLDEIPQKQADIVVDCTGNADGFADALNLVRPRGTIVLKSTYNDLTPADMTTIAVQEVQIMGSRCGPFDVALRFLEEKRVDVLPMIDTTYSLETFAGAFEFAAKTGVLKVLLKL